MGYRFFSAGRRHIHQSGVGECVSSVLAENNGSDDIEKQVPTTAATTSTGAINTTKEQTTTKQNISAAVQLAKPNFNNKQTTCNCNNTNNNNSGATATEASSPSPSQQWHCKQQQATARTLQSQQPSTHTIVHSHG